MNRKLCSLESHLFEALKDFSIEDYQLILYKIKLNMPWQTSSSRLLFRQGLLVNLITNTSFSATGECAPMAEIGTESLEQAHTILEKKLASCQGKPITAELLSEMDSFPASRFALESALLSLLEKHTSQTIAQILNPQYSHTIKTNTMLGSLDDKLLCRAKQAELNGFSCLKIKFGLGDIETEAKALIPVLKQLSSTTQIRIDANKSWTYEQTKWLLDYLKFMLKTRINQIDSIEEPLLDFNLKHYKSLQDSTNIALALDESFSEKIDLKRFPVRRLVLKPTVQGGIIKTWQLARQAKQFNIETIITSSIETGYGLWPITYLCAALNASIKKEQFHGLATASWLEQTLITPPEIKHGVITI